MKDTAQSDKIIIIPQDIMNEMISYSKNLYPEEACGILGGNDNRVSIIYKMENIEKSPVSYMMDPKEQFMVMKDLRKKNLNMLAIFHSHTGTEPYPSLKDINLAFYPVIYIILGLASDPPIVKAYSIEEQKYVKSVRIVIDN